jgi:hypothetical protein
MRKDEMLVIVVHNPYPSAPRERTTIGIVIMFRATEIIFARPEVAVAKRRDLFLLEAAEAASAVSVAIHLDRRVDISFRIALFCGDGINATIHCPQT